MARGRLTFFVIAAALIINYCESEMLMRTSQAKFFPPDSVPPEETVELWMGRTALPVSTDADVTSGCDVDAWPRHGFAGSGRLRALVGVLNCLRCQRPHVGGGRVGKECRQRAQCERKCTGAHAAMDACRQRCQLEPVNTPEEGGSSYRWPSFLGGATLNQNQDQKGEEREERGEEGERVQRQEGEDSTPLTLKQQQRLGLLTLRPKPKTKRSSLDLSPILMRLNHLRGIRSSPITHHKMTKRYRLGLYDCISSYCGKLSGPSRQLCIINYCHRSSTLKK